MLGGMRALVLENSSTAPLGLLERELLARGISTEIVRAYEGGELSGLDGFDLVVSLGSEASAYDERLSWVAPERALLREAVARELPVLGICFGGQLLAQALGAQVRRSEQPEIGWCEITSTEPSIASGPWFEWHLDTFDWPEGAERLAWNHAAPQAFRLGRAVGLQFHPEVTPALVREWVEDDLPAVARVHGEAAALLRETEAVAPEAERAARALFAAQLDAIVSRP